MTAYDYDKIYNVLLESYTATALKAMVVEDETCQPLAVALSKLDPLADIDEVVDVLVMTLEDLPSSQQKLLTGYVLRKVYRQNPDSYNQHGPYTRSEDPAASSGPNLKQKFNSIRWPSGWKLVLTAAGIFFMVGGLFVPFFITSGPPAVPPTATFTPQTALDFYNLGVGYTQNNQFEAAIEAYTQAIERDPNFEAAFGNRGLVQYALGNLAQAQSDLETALSLTDDPQTQAAIEEILAQLAAEQP